MEVSFSSSFLKEGTLVSTKVSESRIWYPNVVYKSEENKVKIGLIDAYLLNMILPGTSMLLKVSTEHFEYIFESTVSRICPGVPASITLLVNKAEEMVNSRINARYVVHLPAHIKPVGVETDNYAVITSLSMGGISFISSGSFDYDEECTAVIYLPGDSRLSCKGRIFRKMISENRMEYVMNNVYMNENESNVLAGYIRYINTKQEAVIDDYNKNIKILIKDEDI
ncbi:MAG TPA: hypothetical protein VF941_20790 [Clostridia bacterium]